MEMCQRPRATPVFQPILYPWVPPDAATLPADSIMGTINTSLATRFFLKNCAGWTAGVWHRPANCRNRGEGFEVSGGLGFYANFVDPDLVGKPVKKGEYKTATAGLVSLYTKYLIKITVLWR